MMKLKAEWSNTILNLIHGLSILFIQWTSLFWMKWLALKYQTKLIKSKDIYQSIINEMIQQLIDFLLSFHRMLFTIFRRNYLYSNPVYYSLEMITYKNGQWTKHEIDTISKLQSLGNNLSLSQVCL